MQSIIEEIWQGGIDPMGSGIFGTPEMKELLGYIARHREELEKGLTDEQKETLEKMMDCRNEYDSHAEKAIFVYGFKLGARIMAEVMSEVSSQQI